MPIGHTCSCGKKLRIKEEYSGRKFQCPQCGVVSRIGAAAPSQPVPTPPPGPPLVSVVPDAPPLVTVVPDNLAFSEIECEPVAAPIRPPVSASQKRSASSKRSRKWWFNRKIQLLPLFAGVCLTVCAVLVGKMALYELLNGQRSKSWPSVQGTVTESGVEYKRKQSRRGFSHYEAVVRYNFMVNGLRYSGSRVSFASTIHLTESAAKEEAGKYPVNSTPMVFYDPSNPSCCALEQGSNSLSMLLLVVVPIVMGGIGSRLIWKSGTQPETRKR